VRIPDRPIWIDGRLCRGEAAVLSLFDRGARDGEGLFETLRVYRGRPFQWERHLERLVVSAAELGFPVPPPPSTLLGAAEEVLASGGLLDAVIRVTVTRGIPGRRPGRCGCWVDAEPLGSRLWRGARSGSAAAIFSRRAFHPGSLGRHKTTSRLIYHLARDEARAAGADEALLVTAEGAALEGASSNLFVVIGGEVLTPPLSAGILPGITRALVLSACAELGIPARECALPREQVVGADEVFLTSSVQEVVPLSRVDGREIPGRSVGVRLLEAYGGSVAATV